LGGSIELVVFPRAYDAFAALWEPDRVVKVDGKLSTKDRDGRTGGELKILVDRAETLEAKPKTVLSASQTEPNSVAQLVINIPDTSDGDKLAQMKELLSQYKGDDEVVVSIGDEATRIKLPFTVDASAQLREALQELLSSAAIAIK
jgi:DNA polymerase III alpha subunit